MTSRTVVSMWCTSSTQAMQHDPTARAGEPVVAEVGFEHREAGGNGSGGHRA